jgi:hypothetical protein
VCGVSSRVDLPEVAQMIRDILGNKRYWDEQVGNSIESTQRKMLALKTWRADPVGSPAYALGLCVEFLELILRRYSRGDEVAELASSFEELLQTWSLARQLERFVGAEGASQTLAPHRLDHYVWCLWLVSLALIFDIDDEPWENLLTLIGGEGQDVLLDRLVAVRTPNRVCAGRLLHPKPYQRLLDAISAEPSDRSERLAGFVAHWHAELGRPAGQGLYWHGYGSDGYHLGLDDGYFGHWCLEALAVSIAFDIDDTLCIELVNYPSDLSEGHVLLKHSRLPKNRFLRSRPRTAKVRHG